MNNDQSYTAPVPDINRIKKLITVDERYTRRQSVEHRRIKGGLALRIGTTVKLAAQHQFGTRKATQRRGGSKA